MEILDIVLRLLTAAAVGVFLGLNRDLRGKPTGVRTLGLVGLGSAVAVAAFGHANGADASCVIQGIVTGIGFLGAGVIVRGDQGGHVHGLTTAACARVTACLGAACGLGEWRIVLPGLLIVMIMLIFGGPFEKSIHRRWPQPPNVDSD